MSKIKIEQFGENLPATGLAGISQAAVGLGIGLLLSTRIKRKVREKIGFGLITAGAAVLIPFLAGVITRVSNRPESARRVRKQLESIRHDAGFDDVEDSIS
ncbi:MAG: hypothetical protein ACK5LK_09780 [Chthoniobacterales bacterium]